MLDVTRVEETKNENAWKNFEMKHISKTGQLNNLKKQKKKKNS